MEKGSRPMPSGVCKLYCINGGRLTDFSCSEHVLNDIAQLSGMDFCYLFNQKPLNFLVIQECRASLTLENEVVHGLAGIYFVDIWRKSESEMGLQLKGIKIWLLCV